MTILICDDDPAIVEAIEIYMKNEGYAVITANNGQEALDCLNTYDVHLIIMDVMMPILDGIRATAKLRETHNVPVLILSAKSEDSDRILGLNIGADDYLTKPFNPIELVARVRSLIRRYTQLGSHVEKSNQFKSGGLFIDDESKEVTLDGEPLKLTPVEYKIVKLLCEHAGKVFSIDQIYERVWEEPPLNADNTVSVHIRRIREKLEIDPKNPKYLKVVWGIGYKIEKYMD